MQPQSSHRVIAAVNLLGLLACSVATAGHWESNFEAAEAESRRTGKPLLVHVYADWCGPCRQMEAQTLHRPVVSGMLGSTVIGVKINADHRSDIVRRFGVSSLPSDVLVDAGGRVIARQTGFQPAGQYVAAISGPAQRAAMQFQPRKPIEREVPQPQYGPENDLQRDRTMLAEKSETERKEAVETTPPPVMIVSTRPPMLRGYSPVALHENREWIKGKSQFAVEYRGQVYRMATQAELDAFNDNPRRYTPRLLGCDPILFAEQDRALMGKLDYAAFYGSGLYLFQSDENRRKFHEDPDRYVTSRVVKLNDIETVTR